MPPGTEDGIRFSIIFPSRERIELLGLLLESIATTTDNLNSIEVLIAVDDDDTPTSEYLSTAPYNFFKFWKVQRSMNFSKDYYNFLAAQSTGRWIICANDDARFETKHWDTLSYDILKDLPSVIYGYCEDGLHGFRARGGGRYCCFPLQGRGGYNALGFIFPNRIPVWGADMHCRLLYDQVGSTVELPITIRHYCHHNKTRAQDGVSLRIAQNQVPYQIRSEQREVSALMAALTGQAPEPVVVNPPVPTRTRPNRPTAKVKMPMQPISRGNRRLWVG